MIPAITPPTDNLYKFISLFGLTIFLFAVYNLGIVYDSSTRNKMRVEDIKIKIQKKLYQQSHKINENLVADSTVDSRYRLIKMKQLIKDISDVEKIVASSGLNPIQIIELNGEISKLKVNLGALKSKEVFCISFSLFGLLLTTFGFFRWHYREQSLRDKILTLEYSIKENERKYLLEQNERR